MLSPTVFIVSAMSLSVVMYSLFELAKSFQIDIETTTEKGRIEALKTASVCVFYAAFGRFPITRSKETGTTICKG